MKLRLLANATLFGLLLLPLAHAQLPYGLKGNIPFEFRVGEKTLPAGEYTVGSVVRGTNLLSMQNFDRTGPGAVFASSAVQAKSAQATKLIFHRYGSTYFLREVWQGQGEPWGLHLQQSKAERVIAHQMASLRNSEVVELALLSVHPSR